MAETNTPELANAVGTDLKQFPFLKQEQAAKEKAVESKIKAETAKESEILKEKGKALEKIGAEDKAKYEETKSLMQPAPEFKPTQDNMMDIGGLFSLVATMGIALGGSGKLSSLNALNAMGGMLKGYQAGRKDLFAKEQAIFDKETARIKEVNDRLIKNLEQYQKLRVTDKEAALVKAQEIASTNPGVIAQLIQSGRDDVAAEIAKRNSDMIIKMRELAAKHGVGSSGGARSAINERFQNTVLRSGNEIVRSLGLIEQIGIDTGGGALGGVVGKGSITSELAANLGRALTTEDQKAYNAAAGGMALELAYVLNGGYKPNQSQIDELRNLYMATPQDTLGTAAYKFADVTAKLKAALEVAPDYTPDQKRYKEEILAKLEKYAPPEVVYERQFGQPLRTEPAVRMDQGGAKPVPTEADRERGRSNPQSRQNFINHFGVEP